MWSKDAFVYMALSVLVFETIAPGWVSRVILRTKFLLFDFDYWIQKACLLRHLLPENDIFLQLRISRVIIQLRLIRSLIFEVFLDVFADGHSLALTISMFKTTIASQVDRRPSTLPCRVIEWLICILDKHAIITQLSRNSCRFTQVIIAQMLLAHSWTTNFEIAIVSQMRLRVLLDLIVWMGSWYFSVGGLDDNFLAFWVVFGSWLVGRGILENLFNMDIESLHLGLARIYRITPLTSRSILLSYRSPIRKPCIHNFLNTNGCVAVYPIFPCGADNCQI